MRFKLMAGGTALALLPGCCCLIPAGESEPNGGGTLRSQASITQPAQKVAPRSVDTGLAPLRANIYPGIQVYFWDRERNETKPVFVIAQVLPDRTLVVRYPDGQEEPKDRNAFQGDAYWVLKSDVLALGGIRTW